LTLDEKLGLVLRHGGDYGINQALAALKLSKGTWHYRQKRKEYVEKHGTLKKPLLAIARAHPHYGYRKVLVELRERGWIANHKVVQKLQKAWELPLLRTVRRPRRSAIRRVVEQLGDRINLVPRLENIQPLQLLYTDFTELLYARDSQKAYLMVLLDHVSKWAVGWAVGKADNSELALQAWERARNRLRRLGIKMRKVVVHHDQDGVYTGHQWLSQLLLRDQVRVSYSLNGARGNTAMESFNGHFKTENRSILWEQKDLKGVIKVVESRLWYYNDIRRHASLDNIAPARFLKNIGINA
jgi:putative transposase